MYTFNQILQFVKEQNLNNFVLLLDNLKGQMWDDFKDAVAGAKGLLWYGLPGATNLWQAVDARYTATLKALIAVEHSKWLDTDNHSDRWFGNEEPYTVKERQILITHWAREAWKALSSAKYDKQRRKCWMMTGCLMTANNGSEDCLIKPEGLDNFSVPPTSTIDPTSQQPTGNHADVQPAELDPAAADPDIEARPDDPIFGPDENEGEKNIS